MTCGEYLASLREEFRPIRVLADKNGDRVIHMRSPRLNRDMVVRHYGRPVAAYGSLRAVRHENLPEVYEVLSLEDGQIVLEEYVPGLTVAQVLEGGCYTYRGAAKVLRGVCAAAMTLHAMGFVHRDIKPENVMVTNAGGVRLIDLNASRRMDPEKSRDTVVLGTIGYASYEQLGISQCDARTDIFALGVLLNVMLTGQHPSRELAKGRAGRIVLKCTQIDPGSRYQSIEKLLEIL